MAFILPDHPFDPDQLTGSVIGIASALGWHDSGLHQHQRHQLLFAQSGCMTMELEGRVCLLPPTRAAWLPAGTEHRILMRGVVAYRSLYFQPHPELPSTVEVLAINPLLHELIERMALWPWDKPQEHSNGRWHCLWRSWGRRHGSRGSCRCRPIPDWATGYSS